MATIALTEKNFDKILQTHEIVIIDVWAEWCGPCKQYGPIYEKVSNEYPEIVFGKLNTEEETSLAGALGISSIPTTLILREGIGVFQKAGVLTEEALKDIINQVKELDMAEVHADVEKQKKSV